MSKKPTFITAREALVSFMESQAPALNDATMAALVKVSRTGITKIRSGERLPSLQLAAALEEITGIPASAWHPHTEAQGRVAPSWLKRIDASPRKRAPRAKAKAA